ncbi:MAG TPA: OmpA family protein [Allosphingosinicella sp.]|nr:OmpA family protein [Allosphingosinicella sp.]
MRKLLLTGAVATAAIFAASASAQQRWERSPVGHGPGVERGDRESGWSRSEMRAYGFRQTPQGARATMQGDVLFATDSDVLHPGAVARLRPLARYLRANPGVRVAIDGHTDSRGSDAHNQDLSERRAESVREALGDMGVRHARFRVRGHGEDSPTASNASAEGMRLNRRVEITLLGRRASEF